MANRGATVGADDGVHGLTEQIERYAQGNVEEILPGVEEGLLVDPPAEHGENRVLEEEVEGGEDQTGGQAEYHGVADAAARPLVLAGPQADANQSTAAVADEHGNGQSYHGQGKHHRVGGVTVGAQIGRVGDEDLVHDVVQGCYQQGYDAGHGVPGHQRPDGVGDQEGIGALFLFHFK